jgi:hypothetical protein
MKWRLLIFVILLIGDIALEERAERLRFESMVETSFMQAAARNFQP